MTKEFLKYQYLKQTILLIAWYQIELSKDYKTDQLTLIKDSKELLDNLNISDQKLDVVLQEIVRDDKWLVHPKDPLTNKPQLSIFTLRAKGRQEIDELTKSRLEKLVDWLKRVAPRVASLVADAVVPSLTPDLTKFAPQRK